MLEFSWGEFQHYVISPQGKYDILDFSWEEIEHSRELRNPHWLFDFSPGEIQNVIFLPRRIHAML